MILDSLKWNAEANGNANADRFLETVKAINTYGSKNALFADEDKNRD